MTVKLTRDKIKRIVLWLFFNYDMDGATITLDVTGEEVTVEEVVDEMSKFIERYLGDTSDEDHN